MAALISEQQMTFTNGRKIMKGVLALTVLLLALSPAFADDGNDGAFDSNWRNREV